MPRKPKAELVRAEILPPTVTVTESEFKRAVAQAVEQEVAKVMQGRDALFQPWFQTREILRELKKRQSIAEQNKFRYYFDEWGCIRCGTKDRGHAGLGFCEPCRSLVKHRLDAGMRKNGPASSEGDLRFMDTVRLAREALAPALRVLPETTAPHARRKRDR